MIFRPRNKKYLIAQEIRYGTEKFSQKVYFMSILMFVTVVVIHSHLGMPSIKLGDIKYEEYH